MRNLQIWMMAARPKTWIASISPVLIGASLALSSGFFHFWIFFFTLMTALGIQITTNFANDYFDFLKGADTTSRKGPTRVMQASLVSVKEMKMAIFTSVFITFISGSYLIWHSGLVICLLLCISLLLAILYTAGPFALAYLGLGEVFVFLFFGLIASSATYYLQTQSFSLISLLAGIAPGALSSAILVVNNLRDIEEDRIASKKTLIVRFGILFGKIEYLFALILPFFPLLYFYQSYPYILITLLALFPTAICVRKIFDLQYQELFAKTGQLLWLYTLLFCIGCLI